MPAKDRVKTTAQLAKRQHNIEAYERRNAALKEEQRTRHLARIQGEADRAKPPE